MGKLNNRIGNPIPSTRSKRSRSITAENPDTKKLETVSKSEGL